MSNVIEQQQLSLHNSTKSHL